MSSACDDCENADRERAIPRRTPRWPGPCRDNRTPDGRRSPRLPSSTGTTIVTIAGCCRPNAGEDEEHAGRSCESKHAKELGPDRRSSRPRGTRWCRTRRSSPPTRARIRAPRCAASARHRPSRPARGPSPQWHRPTQADTTTSTDCPAAPRSCSMSSNVPASKTSAPMKRRKRRVMIHEEARAVPDAVPEFRAGYGAQCARARQ